MVTDQDIARINELYKKAKAEGLTDEEKLEQATLRGAYIEAMRNNLRGQLDNIKIKKPDGTVEDLKKFNKERTTQ